MLWASKEPDCASSELLSRVRFCEPALYQDEAQLRFRFLECVCVQSVCWKLFLKRLFFLDVLSLV